MTEPNLKAQHIGIVGCLGPKAPRFVITRTACSGRGVAGALWPPRGFAGIRRRSRPMSTVSTAPTGRAWLTSCSPPPTSSRGSGRISSFVGTPSTRPCRLSCSVLARGPVPPIAEVVADEAVRRGFRRLGLTGTRWLVGGPVYADAFAARGLELVRPTAQQREDVNRIIMEELAAAKFRPDSSPISRSLSSAWGRTVAAPRPRLHRNPAHHQRRPRIRRCRPSTRPGCSLQQRCGERWRVALGS